MAEIRNEVSGSRKYWRRHGTNRALSLPVRTETDTAASENCGNNHEAEHRHKF